MSLLLVATRAVCIPLIIEIFESPSVIDGEKMSVLSALRGSLALNHLNGGFRHREQHGFAPLTQNSINPRNISAASPNCKSQRQKIYRMWKIVVSRYCVTLYDARGGHPLCQS